MQLWAISLESQRFHMITNLMRFLILSAASPGALTLPLSKATEMKAELNEKAGTSKFFREGKAEQILKQGTNTNSIPHIHLITTPDGDGKLTPSTPGHQNPMSSAT